MALFRRRHAAAPTTPAITVDSEVEVARAQVALDVNLRTKSVLDAAIGSGGRISERAWQDVIRDAMHTNGLVSQTVMLPSKIASKAVLYIERLEGGRWRRVGPGDGRDAAAASEILRRFQAQSGGQAHLIERMFMFWSSIGAMRLLRFEDPVTGEMVWDVVDPKAVKRVDDEWRWMHTRDKGNEHYTVIGDNNHYALWMADPLYRDEATSPLRPTVPDIETMATVTRALNVAAESRLLTNGILWAPVAPGDAENDWRDDYMQLLQRQSRSADTEKLRMPFPLATDQAPVFLPVGQEIQETLLELQRDARASFAAGADLPHSLVAEGAGPSQAGHHSAQVARRELAENTVVPRLQAILNELSHLLLHRQLTFIARNDPTFFDEGFNPRNYRISFDGQPLVARLDISELALSLFQAGVMSREAAARTIGIPATDLLELPEGVEDWDAWLMLRQGASGARHDSAERQPQTPVLDRSPTTQPRNPGGTVPQPAPPAPVSGAPSGREQFTLTRANINPTLGPVVAQLGEALQSIDDEFVARVQGALEANVASAAARVAIRLSAAVKATHLPNDARVRFEATKDPFEKVRSLPKTVRAKLTPVETDAATSAVEDVRPQLEAMIEDEQGRIVSVIADQLGLDVEVVRASFGELHAEDRARAGEAAVALMSTIVLSRLNAASDRDEAVRTAIPFEVANDVVGVAGGMDAGPRGRPAADADGHPLSRGAFAVGAGLALGSTVIDALNRRLIAAAFGQRGIQPSSGTGALLEDYGVRLDTVSTWTHGRAGEEFGPHAALHGRSWRTPAERAEITRNTNGWPPGDQHHPGSHAGCGCRIRSRLELTNI